MLDSCRAAALTVVVSVVPCPAWPEASPDAAVDLTSLSLEELVQVKVTTVSRKPEPAWSAPSGIDVVSGDDIRRSGVETLPDALRLGVGVHVGQPSARSWAVSIRGMNVLAANKISVAMDGRSLFTPFFSGVSWDAQDTLLEDVDRIEIVRGPVGALWGAFAVNGFIQILTKPAWETPGLLLTAGAGTEDPGFFRVRYGGKLGQETSYRAYAKYFQTEWTYDASGTQPQGATDFGQAGFRVDHRLPAESTLTLQGDLYTNRNLPLDRVQSEISGGNVLGRWRRPLRDGGDLQLEGYFDQTYRLIPANFEETRRTGSASAKYRRHLGRHELMVGADALVSADEIGNIGIAQLLPGERTIHTLGFYAQDAWRVSPPVTLLAGVKAEQSSFAGWEVQPTLRLAWTPSATRTVWAAVSRGVRTPVRVDEDLAIRTGDLTLFAANDDFRTETALAYEIGVRQRLGSTLSVGASAFRYRYDHLRSTEPAGAAPVPLTFLNTLNAESHGGEVAVLFQPVPRVLLKGAYRFLDLRFETDPGSRHTRRGQAEGNDPRHVWLVRGYVSLPANLEATAIVRGASDLPDPPLEGYTTLDLRLGWRPTGRLELSIAGRNLLDEQHAEFVTTNSLNEQVHRRATVKVTWRQ